MSWQKTVDRYGETIEENLRIFFAKTIEEAEHYHPLITKVYRDLEELVLRKGRRLASCSTLLTYLGYMGTVDPKILKVCVGIELYRHSILVHDDLVDMDNLRRGGSTLHRKFIEDYDTRFGEGIAVFAGNIAYALATRAIIDSGFPEEKVGKLLLLLSKGYVEVNESQILDLLFEYKDVNIKEWRIMASKRAASLFKVTMLTGAILGGAPEKDLWTLGEAAENMGYSFDIQDDIIDTFAREEQYGRPPCGDITLRKKPLHIIYALKSAYPRESKGLKKLLGKKNISRDDIELVRTVIRESGGLEAAKNTSKKHAEQARALLDQTNLRNEAKAFFKSLTIYIQESLDWYK